MPALPSPRLPGVIVLRPDASGPEYTRWRRGVKSAFIAKKTWGHCDGSCPMPMPEAGPNFFSPVSSPTNPQPQLLEERRSWVKKDRDVKLDIFLSIADDIKLEVFEVGPPLPPSALTAKEMLEALDERFESFKFEEYHHVFCHFLNLHIDQYSNIEDFNAEFQATLEDLLDHGHPMSNIQACSAYFSKLRCTQNPWVAQKLKEWDTQNPEPKLTNLMKQSPPWSIIRPLTTTFKPASQQSIPDSIPGETLEDSPPQSDGEDTPSERSEVTTLSSKSSHSRHSSRSTQKSQEITVHASYEDLTELYAFPNVPVTKFPPTIIPKRASSISKLSLQTPPPPMNRPLPPLPAELGGKPIARSWSLSDNTSSRDTAPETSLKAPTSAQSNSSPSLDQIHPALRPSPTPTSEPATSVESQADVHPGLRALPQPTRTPVPEVQVASPAGHISSTMRLRTPTPPLTQSGFLPSSPNPSTTPSSSTSTPNLAPPYKPSRPQSARSTNAPEALWSRPPLLRIDSNNSSVISLPLQGAIVPEFHDTTITESPPKEKRSLRDMGAKIEMARMRFEGRASPTRTLTPSDEEKKCRKRSWSIKARLSARHGVKEII